MELLRILGRTGRHAVIEALKQAPGPWNLAQLAEAAGVHPVVAGRAVRELESVACVDVLRPGRDMRVRFLPESVAGKFLRDLAVPDVARLAAVAFADAFTARADVRWTGRVVVLSNDEDGAWDAVGPALDAVRLAGLPLPEVDVFPRDVEDDAIRQAVQLR